ncbi:hypothetical protein LCGC14_3103150 [marine sediment metagenome]|uniref:Uncharacterized protein n=1 Tax=marine sediment metagenome TaxID=412755 RepID=A0A0F8YX76_9ZZZZ
MKFVFTKENAYGVTRTFVPFFYAWLIGLAPFVQDWLATVNLTAEGFVLLFGGLLYEGIRVVAEKVPWVGNLLIFNTKPDYGLTT